jgi:MFS family permease
VIGGLCAGWIGDRVIHHRRNGRLLAAAIISAIGAPFAYFGAVQPKGALIAAVALWMVAYATMNSYYGLVYSSIQDIVAPAQRGATMALYFMAMYLCGASFGPLLTGRLSDYFARQSAGAGPMTDLARAVGLQQAMLIVPVLSLLLGIVLYMGSRTIEKDMDARVGNLKAATVNRTG